LETDPRLLAPTTAFENSRYKTPSPPKPREFKIPSRDYQVPEHLIRPTEGLEHAKTVKFVPEPEDPREKSWNKFTSVKKLIKFFSGDKEDTNQSPPKPKRLVCLILYSMIYSNYHRISLIDF